MRITRLVAGATAAGLLGLVPVAIGTPADAAVTVATATSLTSSQTKYTYGDRIFFDAAVTTADPDHAYAPGTATLYVMRKGTSTWEPVSTDEGVSYLYFPDVTAPSNADYKVVYPGGTNSYTGDVYLPSESPVFSIRTTRKVVFKNPKSTIITGKITPDYAKKKIKVQKKVGGKWRKYKTFKTTSAGKYRFKLPAPRRGKWQWKITVPGTTEFTKWQTKGSTYSYRPVQGRATGFRR